jgi:hypothetical protein
MEMFMIGDNDYTKYITVPSYKVNKNPITTEWTDVLKTKHQEVVRTRIEGTFSMLFDDPVELDKFLDDVENNMTTGNYIHLKVYENKRRDLIESDFFIEFELQNDRPYFRIKTHETFEVQIEER